MQRTSISIRNKLMVACACVVACVLATPAALAHGHHDRRDHSGDVVAALVVGAVVGAVLVGASHQHDRYYGTRYYYPRAYPPPPRYYYGSSGYYRYPTHGSVHVGVVYSSRDHRWHDRRSHGQYRYHSYRARHDGRGSHWASH